MVSYMIVGILCACDYACLVNEVGLTWSCMFECRVLSSRWLQRSEVLFGYLFKCAKVSTYKSVLNSNEGGLPRLCCVGLALPFLVFQTSNLSLCSQPLFIFDDKYRLNVEEKKQQSDYRPGGGVPRGSPRGGFRGGFNSARGSGGRGVWRGGRGGRGGSGYGSGRSGDDDAAGDDRNYERPQ